MTGLLLVGLLMQTPIIGNGYSIDMTPTADGAAISITITPPSAPPLPTPPGVYAQPPAPPVPFQHLTIYGDSTATTNVSGAPTPAQSFAALVTAATGSVLDDRAVSGAQAADLAGSVYQETAAAGHVYLYHTGVNDERIYGTDAARVRIMADAQIAQLAWLALPESQKIRVRTGGVSLSGSSWAPTAVYGLGMRSIVAGESASAHISGTTIYVGVIQQDHAPGQADLFVDGRWVQRFTCYGDFGLLATQNGASYTSKLLRVANLPPGLHTVSIVTVNASTSGPVYLDWIGGTDGVPSWNRPLVLVGNSIPGFNLLNSTSPQAVEAVNDWIAAEVAMLQGDGLNVWPVDAFSAINDPAGQLNSDGVHPNATGHAKIAAAYLAMLAGVSFTP